jgi:hypothetical protein
LELGICLLDGFAQFADVAIVSLAEVVELVGKDFDVSFQSIHLGFLLIFLVILVPSLRLRRNRSWCLSVVTAGG